MPRPPYKKKTVPLRVTTSNEVLRYLEQLVAGGLHGPTAPEAAAVLMNQQIQHLIETGYLEKIRPEGG